LGGRATDGKELDRLRTQQVNAFYWFQGAQELATVSASVFF
jgi:hypothetical protein